MGIEENKALVREYFRRMQAGGYYADRLAA